MTTELRKHQHRHRRRSHRKVRVVSLTLAGMSFAMAAVMLVWARSEQSASHRLFGIGYLVAGFLVNDAPGVAAATPWRPESTP